MSEDEHQATSTEVTLSVSAEIAPTKDDNSSPHKNDIVEREELYRDKKEEDAIQKCLDAGAPDVETEKRWLEDAMRG